MLTRFDVTVLGVIAGLITLIGLTAIFGITATPERVAYLKISDGGYYQLWLADPEEPERARQMTDAEYGVFDYDISADGQRVVFSERDFETGISEIKLLDLRTREVQQLTNCIMEDSDCDAPAMRPDGEMVAYQRRNLNTELGMAAGQIRIWILDISGPEPVTYPLFEESQIIGYEPKWSADGQSLAFYDTANAGILVYDFAAPDAPLSFVPTNLGVVGSLSPDGNEMIFPEMLMAGGQARSYLQLADLARGTFETIADPNAPIDDQQTAWSPDGRFVAIGRRYWDERYTLGAQIYLLDTRDGTISPLVVDENFANALFDWNADGTRLTMQRFEQLQPGDPNYGQNTTEVWTYDLETRELTRIDTNSRNPKWVAGD